MATSNYYLYDPKASKETLIILRFRYNHSLLAYSTRQRIHPNNWNHKKKRAKESKAFNQYEELNKLLNALEDEAFNLYRSAINRSESVSNDYLKQGLNKFLKIDSSPVNEAQKCMLSFFEYLDLFISESDNGIRRQKNGSKISKNTIKGYKTLKENLKSFSTVKSFKLDVKSINGVSSDAMTSLKSYWKSFYNHFTDYLYEDLDCYDNAVGAKIKNLRVFFNYLNEDKNLDIGEFHKSFYQPKEDIQIVVLSPEQLHYLIFDTELDSRLSERLRRVRDIFVFGSTVALRVSDLLSLTTRNIEVANEEYSLNVSAIKTGNFTSIKLPDYCVEIIKRYQGMYPTLLPSISDVKLNEYLKELGSLCNWNESVIKTRFKRGKTVVQYKDDSTHEHFTFSDRLTTHTMRRTAITTSLILGMPEFAVRELSGHKPGSSEFFKYVRLAKDFMNKNVNDMANRLSSINQTANLRA